MDEEIRVGDWVEVVDDTPMGTGSPFVSPHPTENRILQAGDRLRVAALGTWKDKTLVGYVVEYDTARTHIIFGNDHDSLLLARVRRVGGKKCNCTIAQLMAAGCACGGA